LSSTVFLKLTDADSPRRTLTKSHVTSARILDSFLTMAYQTPIYRTIYIYIYIYIYIHVAFIQNQTGQTDRRGHSLDIETADPDSEVTQK